MSHNDVIIILLICITEKQTSHFLGTPTINHSLQVIIQAKQAPHNNDRLTAFDPGQPG